MKHKLLTLLLLCLFLPALAETGLKGVVVDARTGKPVADANILLTEQGKFVASSADGYFSISDAKAGHDVLQVIAYGYADLDVDVEILGGMVKNLGEIKLTPDDSDNTLDMSDMIIDESELFDDEGNSQSIGSILGAVDNIYYTSARYDFQPMYFNFRGYDSEYTQGYINGMDFNDPGRGRFNFSGLGGMTSSAFRNSQTGVGTEAVNYGFSGLGGSTNYSTLASEYATGFRGSLSYTNSNYMMRAMLQYSSGINKHGWAFSAAVIGRYAPEGVMPGTFYNSFGYFLSVQKIFNEKHSLNLTTWGAPTQRAVGSATYDEAYQLADNNLYNPNWGWQDGKKRSAKVRYQFDPSAILNWIWKPRQGTVVNTGVGFRHNEYTTSALNWYQAADPRPDYYRYLPSYYAPTAEEGTELYDQQMQVYDYYTYLWHNNIGGIRQIDWNQIYQTNLQNRDSFDRNPALKGHSTYILENRRSTFTSWMFNSNINHRLNDAMTLQGGVSFNYTDSRSYKTIKDLLGGEFWLDIDNFSERDFPGNPTMLQNDLNNPNRRVKDGDVFGYDYNIRSFTAKAWVQNRITTPHWDVNYGLFVAYTNFMRHGNMRNGRAPENSYGAGLRHTFDDAGIKAGVTYKLNGRNYFVLHASYGTKAPLYDYAYVSPRVKDTAITGLQSERYISGDISYVWNYSRFRGSITGFWTNTYDGTERTSFYDDQYSTFMNYVMAGVNKRYRGVELGLSYKITSNLTVSAAGTFARYQYTNRPRGIRSYENGTMPDMETTVYIKNFYLGGTPQQAYNISLDYTAPGMWFFNINGSWMGDAYVDLSPIRHEPLPNLYKVCNSQEELEAKMAEIATQDKLNDAFVLNASIGKLIYTRFGSVSVNVSVTNLLNNRNIMTNGYQQGRFDYKNFDLGKYPNKYSYAQGTRVFVNLGIKF